jgi:hypothetical protein
MLRKFVTEVRAVDPVDERLKTFSGLDIEAISFELAEQWCRENLAYCKVVGELLVDGDIDYHKIQNN